MRKPHEIYTYPPIQEGEVRKLLFSIDFSAMELCTVAQTCLDIPEIGFSVLADKINAGYDTHAYLGAQIAYASDDDFRQDVIDDPEEAYRYLNSLKGSKAKWKGDGYETEGDFFKHYRKFAKPTGLGYPGGLGYDTFIQFARSPYGVIIDKDTAIKLKNIWLTTYPEFQIYFKYIKKFMVDSRNGKTELERDDGKVDKVDQYVYTTPMGMIRSGCSFTAAANGNGMQSPGAEGAGYGMVEITREIHCSENELLAPDHRGFPVKPTNFIHDEYFGEMVDDGPDLNTARMKEVCRIAETAFEEVTPDVKATAEAALMRRAWIKFIDPEYDHKGRLIPWDDVKENHEKAIKRKWLLS